MLHLILAGELDRQCISADRSTPEDTVGWFNVNIVGAARSGLGVSVGFDTDVNAAALAEGRWGAARGQDTFGYLTVGTGIGAGAVVEGQVIHGLGHPRDRPPQRAAPAR